MPSLLTFAAPIVLVLPFLGQGGLWLVNERAAPGPAVAVLAGDAADTPQSVVSGTAKHNDASAVTLPNSGSRRSEAAVRPAGQTTPLEAFYQGQVTHQFRIEQRLTIRISPQSSNNRIELLAQLPQQGVQNTFEEREMDSCVALAGIAGVQTANGNRLLLFLRDERIVTLNLERACRARDFYSGFYVERNEDGQLCVARDQLLSRSGVKCEIARMSQLVAVEE